MSRNPSRNPTAPFPSGLNTRGRGRGRSPHGRGQNGPVQGSGRGGRGEDFPLQQPPPQQRTYPPQEYSMGGQYGPPPTSTSGHYGPPPMTTSGQYCPPPTTFYDGSSEPSGYNLPPGRPFCPPPPSIPLPHDEDYSQSRQRQDKGNKRSRDPSPLRRSPSQSSRHKELMRRLENAGLDENVIRCLDLDDEATNLALTDLLEALATMYKEVKHLRDKTKRLTERAFAPSRQSRQGSNDDRTGDSSRPSSSTRSRLQPPSSSRASISHSAPQPHVPLSSGDRSNLDTDTLMADVSDYATRENAYPHGWMYSDPVNVFVPGELVPKPTITKDSRVDQPPKSKTKDWSMYRSDSDDDQEDVEEEKSDSELTAKQRQRKQLRLEQQRREHERHRMRNQGRIPDTWGVVRPRNVTERDNAMRYMLSWRVHHSPRTNIVATGESAQQQSLADINERPPYEPRHVVYQAAPRGLPLNPYEVEQLRSVVSNLRVNPAHRVEAHMLLHELYIIAQRTMPHCRDRAMQHILDCGFKNELAPRDIPEDSAAWTVLSRAITRNFQGVLTGRHDNPTRGAGVQQPAMEEMLHVDIVGQWLLLHGRPGMKNFINGTVINYQYAVHRRSAFGYGLMRLLAPQDRTSQVAYNRRLAIIMASPNMYREAIARYNEGHPAAPFQEQHRTYFTFRRANFPANSIGNLSVDDVLLSLIFNRVPPAWIDHAYLYGLYCMAHSFTGSALHEDLYRQHDEERLRRLRAFGVPPAIPEWDGWRYPTREDYLRLLILSRNEEDSGRERAFWDGRWLLVGESPYFTRLQDGPHQARNILGLAPASASNEGTVNSSTVSSSATLTTAMVAPSTSIVTEPITTHDDQEMGEIPDVTIPVESSTEPVGGETVIELVTASTDPVAAPTDSTA